LSQSYIVKLFGGSIILDDLLITETFKDILLITLNRPEKRNSLNQELVAVFSNKIDEICKDNSIRAVIITGKGKAFCSGADLAYLEKLSHFSESENLEDSQSLAELYLKIYNLPKLTVAMLNGPALAGGCGLTLCCDYIIADRNLAQLGFTEVRIGFIPAIVMNFLVRRIPLHAAYKLVLGAGILSAEKSFHYGLVDMIFESSEIKSETFAFIEKLLGQNSLSAMMTTKKLFRDLLDLPLKEGIDLACKVNAQSRKTADCQKGLNKFLKKEQINWRE
jgi:methylglutaconyl-CoA hydratase